MPTLREYLELAIADIDDALNHHEMTKRSMLASRQKLVDALNELPQEPVEPEIPEGKQPIINDIVVSADRKLITVAWEHDTAVNVTTSNGEKSASGVDTENPLNIAVGSDLAKGFTVVDEAFQGRIIVTLSEGGQSVTDERFIAAPTLPTTPEVPEIPVTPEVPNIFPFPLQKRGETPELVRKPDELIDITDLLGGSHKVPNHISRRAFELKGNEFIGGSSRTVVDLNERKAIFTFSGINAVTWSAVQDGVAWGINSEAIWRYENRRITRYIEPKDLGFRSFSVEAEGEFIDGYDRYAWLKADNAFLIRVDLRERRVANRWAISGSHDMWPIDYSGRLGILDTLPGSPASQGLDPFDAQWRFYDNDTNKIYETEELHTAHATSVNGGLVDVYGMFYSADNLKGSDRLRGIGNGVSTAQHVQYNHAANAVVWTQGSKSAPRKQIDLVTMDGQSFAYLAEVGRLGWSNGGEIYATSWLGNGVFKLAYADDNRVMVATWRRG